MEILKKNIHMNRQKSRAVKQVTLEEDWNVPDSKPDVRNIIQQEGMVKIEDTRIMDHHFIISGKLEVKLLYICDGEEKQIHRLDTHIPFEEKINLEGAEKGDNIQVKWDMEDIHIHTINSRKLSILALITFLASIEEVYDAQAAVEIHGMEELSTKTKTIQPLSLAAQKKDILRMKEEVNLASNKPNIGEILWESIQLRGTDLRVQEGQLEIRGELFMFVLYLGDDENGTKQWIETSIPFKGNVECAGCTPEMIPDIDIALSSGNLEVRPDFDGEERMIQVEAVLDLDMKLYEEDTVEILEDLYSPVKELTPVTSQQSYESLVIKNFSKCRAGERLRMDARQPRMLQICHSRGEIKIDETKMTEQGIQVDGAVHVDILYITADDSLPFALMTGMVPFQHTIQVEGMNSNCRFQLKTELEQLSTSMIDSEELEVKAAVNLGVLILCIHEEECIVDVEERPLDYNKIQDLPGIVGYITQPGDTLWSIAKTYYTTPEHIRKLNGMEEKEAEVGSRLIIVKDAAKIV